MKYMIIISLLFCTSTLSAQNTLLTKEETINYLAKKFKEVDGLYTDNGMWKYSHCDLTWVNNNIELTYRHTYNGDNVTDFTIRFNPLYITRIDNSRGITDVGVLEIFLSIPGQSTQSNHNGTFPRSTKEVNIMFLGSSSDRTNGDKIKKALLHLQQLLKAEDDPFGE